MGLVGRRTLILAAAAAGCGLRPGRSRGEPRTLTFVFGRPEASPRTQWLIAVYREALAALGYGMHFLDVPPNRATAMVRSGEADGDLGRMSDYGDLYPELVRVEEPNTRVRLCAFGTDQLERVQGWDWLADYPYQLSYRRGIKLAEAHFANHPELGVLGVNDTAQGLKLLQFRRSGLYLDIEEAVYDYLSTPQAYETLQRGLPIIEAGVMEQQTGHAFLNRSSCGDLASALSDTLREMKANGRCALLLAQALAAAGYRDRPLFGPRPG
jgi:hypothetical protein